MSDDRAFILGTGAGLIEIATENIGYDAIFGADKMSRGAFRYMVGAAGAEGAEEGTSDLLNWAADWLYDVVTGENSSEFKLTVRRYQNEGHSPEEAVGLAAGDYLEEFGLDTLGGMLSGGILSGGRVVGNAATNQYQITKPGHSMEVGSTAIDTNPATHTPKEQAIIAEYQASVDEGLAKFYNAAKNGEEVQPYIMKPVSDRAADAIQETLGKDTRGFATVFEPRIAKHVEKRHGEHGQADQSMRDPMDVARMQYVIDHFDRAADGGTTDAYWETDGKGKNRRARTIVFEKKVNGTYYVVEAAPITKARSTYIVSAYMNEAGASHPADANAPALTAKTESVSTPTSGISIPQPDPAVKASETAAKRSGPMSRAELTDQILSRALPLPQGSGDGRMERVVREGVQKGLTKLARTREGKLALFNLALWKGDSFGKAFDDAIVDWVVWNTPDNPTEGSDHLADALYTTLVDYFQNKLADDKPAPKLEEGKTELTRPDDGSTIDGAQDIEKYAAKIHGAIDVDSALLLERAKTGKTHGGVYRDAQKKSRRQLLKSISSRTAQVELHTQKMRSPKLYDKGWDTKDDVAKQGLLKKWGKDLRRNAEQAGIEIEIWKERFGDEP